MAEPLATRPLLDLLASVLREHESHPQQGGTQVLSCLVQDLPWAIDTVAAAIKAAGGTVLNTSSIRAGAETPAEAERYRAAIPGRSDSAVATSIMSVAGFQRSGVDIQVDIHETPHGLDARFAPSSEPSFPLPAADDALLAVVRALCSSRLDRQAGGVAVVIYDETELDGDQLESIWRIRSVLDGLPLGPRTLIFLIVSEDLTGGTHLRGTGGVRFALHGGELHRRHPPSACGAVVADVLRGSGPYIGLFLGAGFSVSSGGLSLGNQLRDRAISALGISRAGSPGEVLARDWYRYIDSTGGLLDSEIGVSIETLAGDLTLERVLREEYRTFAGEDPPTLKAFQKDCDFARTHLGAAPLALADLIRSGRRVVICTVNFDTTVETAAAGLCRRFVDDDDYLAAPDYLARYLAGDEDLAPLFKLHGTIDDLSTCVASDDRTLQGVSRSKEDTLRAVLELTDPAQPAPWLWVGASMRDRDLNQFWARTEFVERVREYWVLPYPPQSVRRFVNEFRTERWNTANAMGFAQRLVTETADTLMERLAAGASSL